MILTSVDSCRLSSSSLTSSKPTAVRPAALLARTPDLGPDLINVQVTEDGSSSRVLPFFLLLNEVTGDGSSSSVLPFVLLLARWSAAWQFNVVPDRGPTSRQGRKVVQTQVAY
jgi:hypothetical protein